MKKRYLDLDNECFTESMPPSLDRAGKYLVLDIDYDHRRHLVLAYTRRDRAHAHTPSAVALAERLLRAEGQPPRPAYVTVDDLVAAFDAYDKWVGTGLYDPPPVVRRLRALLEDRFATRNPTGA